jgi:hypothetical protein
MKRCQITYAIFLICTLLGVATAARAEEAEPAKMLVYISPQDYEHPIKLWHYYYSYWFDQGPAVQPVAIEMLRAEYGDVKMCEGNTLGRALVWIKPRMYYNPQLEVFYGEVTANFFSGNGKVLGTYTGDSRHRGFLNVYPERQIEAAYKEAMQNLMTKIKANPELRAKIDASVTGKEASSCALVALLPPAKTNDVKHYFQPPGYQY